MRDLPVPTSYAFFSNISINQPRGIVKPPLLKGGGFRIAKDGGIAKPPLRNGRLDYSSEPLAALSPIPLQGKAMTPTLFIFLSFPFSFLKSINFFSFILRAGAGYNKDINDMYNNGIIKV